MNITTGVMKSALKVVVYGPEGIGKSSFAARFPEPLFCDTEGSTKFMNVRRLDKPTSWTMLQQQIDYIKRHTDVCKTFIIDTIDWAEQFCIEHICSKHSKKGIEDFGYGNGYVYEKEEFGKFLNSLEELVDLGINVVLTAHAQIRKFEKPDEAGAYDRYELKLGKKTSSLISPLVKEWADMVLFANYKTYVVATDKEGKKNKASGGERVMYTSHHPCWDAKNRFGLPEELPFSFDQIAHLFDPPAAVPAPAVKAEMESIIDTQEAPAIMQRFIIPEGIPKALKDLMEQNEVDESEIRLAVSQRGYYPEDTPITNYDEGFIMGVIVGAWPQVFRMIQDNRDIPFN